MARRLAPLSTLAAALIAAACFATPATAAGLIAPASACPNQEDRAASAAAQEQTMLCMTNFARAASGQGGLEATAALAESARDKARDIFECDSFSHYACGREFTYWMRATGYLSAQCWKVGENLAFGSGEYGSVRSIFRAWMRSPEHRANILGEFSQIGIDIQTGTLGGSARTSVWTQHFGSHC
ncbi:MAG TPA: CAP domain-containing protein [Solirubrobacterales bacterium]|nr:CAP domain-containing protein [Solirubrobacterales bacterium]